MKRFILFACDHYLDIGFGSFRGDFDTPTEALAAIPSEFPGHMRGWDQQQIVDTLLRVSNHRFHDGESYSEWSRKALPGPRAVIVTHSKRGGLYVADRVGKLQLDGPDDMAAITGYTNVVTGEWWCRKSAEFEDGRFTEVDTSDLSQMVSLSVTEMGRHLIKEMTGRLFADYPEFKDGGPVKKR